MSVNMRVVAPDMIFTVVIKTRMHLGSTKVIIKLRKDCRKLLTSNFVRAKVTFSRWNPAFGQKLGSDEIVLLTT